MARTNLNLLTELKDYLTAGGFSAYIDRLPQDQPHEDKYNADGSLKSYIIITGTPANLLRSDMRAANNNRATRTANVFVSCYGIDRMSSGTLADEVDNYLLPDDNAGWHCSDGTPLESWSSWKVDSVNSNSESNVYITNLAYRCKKNLP